MCGLQQFQSFSFRVLYMWRTGTQAGSARRKMSMQKESPKACQKPQNCSVSICHFVHAPSACECFVWSVRPNHRTQCGSTACFENSHKGFRTATAPIGSNHADNSTWGVIRESEGASANITECRRAQDARCVHASQQRWE